VKDEEKPVRGAQARQLARRFFAGVLATQSFKFPGYPYASALPFCTDQQGRPVILISHLAEHTQNADRDPRASFLIAPLTADLQEQPRLTLIGDFAPTEDAATAARYLRYFPEGARYLEIGGFRFFRMQPMSGRFIAGFGSIHTISPQTYVAAEYPLAQAEDDIVAHMNADHRHTLLDYCRYAAGAAPEQAEMVGIDCDGFDVRADGALRRFEFAHEVADAEAARAELVRMARVARA